jgi:catechol 2,3-dioxygenase-like lactoylglutathione lyase family enzyme|tara:strand:+ start:192 stop:593 length:402 start_codon:yes stop_codon:yes gene_type:complete
MPVSSLDHVNIRTANLKDMVSFYSKVLGLKKGKRPAFNFGGAWLYAGKRATVHLVEVNKQPKLNDPQLEHFAFKANDINDTLKKLKKAGAKYETRIVPGGKIRQVHAYDPDGNHVEIAFSTREEAHPKLLRDQ